MRTGAKHLCGQTCLHKLVDEFMAAHHSSRVQPAPDAADEKRPIADDAMPYDASLISRAA